jgi:hypothetical protein
MKLPRLRFTVRGLMIAVAVAAISILMADSLRRLSNEYSEKADRYRVEAHWVLQGYPGNAPDQIRRHDQLLLLATKYDRAARHPWLPVAPNPPEPEE